MTCNVDLLHIGIYTMAAGIAMMIASAMNFRMLAPYEKEALMEERNQLQKAAKQTLIKNNLEVQRRFDFRV